MDNNQEYISKPQVIKAVQFKAGWERPQWLSDAVRVNHVQVTWNSKNKYVNVYGVNQVEKAFLDDWVCLTEHGKIFVMSDQDFKKYWCEHDDRKL